MQSVINDLVLAFPDVKIYSDGNQIDFFQVKNLVDTLLSFRIGNYKRDYIPIGTDIWWICLTSKVRIPKWFVEKYEFRERMTRYFDSAHKIYKIDICGAENLEEGERILESITD